MTTIVPQHLSALELANQARFAAADVKRELAAGTLTVSEAVRDPRAGCLTVTALLVAQPRWGAHRALRCCRAVPVVETKRVRDLTPRQADAISRLVAGTAVDCNPFAGAGR